MAANAWGVAPPVASNWADEADAEEEKHGAVLAPLKRDDDDFPSLAVTKNVKESKKEKKKQQKMSLTDFMRSGASSRQTDDNILMSLPTAPRARAPGEGPSERGMGGGFREYGGQRGGSFRGKEDDDRPRRGREEDMGPSRAEMSDNWGKDRKFESGLGGRDSGFGGGFRDRDSSREGGFNRGGGFDDRPRREVDDGPSRADTSDNWGSNRQFVPSSSRGGFEDRPRSGFGDRDRERGSFGDRDRSYGPPREFREPSKADTEDRWERRGDFQPTAFEERPRGRGFGETWAGGARDGSREGFRREGFRESSQDQWKRGDEAAAGPPSPAANEGPRERPRLSLAPRTAPIEKGEGAVAAPTAAPKANPFGSARPREEVLKEQGRDYRKEELQREHKAAEALRDETEEERELQKEIDDLRVKVEAGEADAPLDPSEGAEGKTVSAVLEECELRLSKLQLELDDKVRYARRQGAEERDGSGPRRSEEGRGFSQERNLESRRFDRDSRDGRRPDDREGGRGFDDRGRREDRYESRSYRDPRGGDGRDSREGPTRGGGRW